MAKTELEARVTAVRGFNRFYTKTIGVLSEGLLDTPFSLAEARVIYELAQRETATAAGLSKELGLDPGYLSRILAGFKRKALIQRRPSPTDGRQTLLQLTKRGRAAFSRLDRASRKEVQTLLDRLSPDEQGRLLKAMEAIQSLLGPRPAQTASYVLRPHQAGDMGWVVHRHGVLYPAEYGWDDRFEALVAEIVARFLRDLDPKKERCWIAEVDGEPVGSVFLVKQSATVAKLRLLLVEPKVRGLGIGTRLVSECIRFARSVGYRKIRLWTNSLLESARRIYQHAGFQLVAEEEHEMFGPRLVGQTWELRL
jgi:DNA-binding MarR family transcriptional regulator/N-acetylglutamate synthase-like GNAT family acetyltransferase